MLECFAFQVFHGDEGSSFKLANVMYGADVRVVEGGSSLGFPLKAAECLWILSEFVGKELQGDKTVERVSSAL